MVLERLWYGIFVFKLNYTFKLYIWNKFVKLTKIDKT